MNFAVEVCPVRSAAFFIQDGRRTWT